MSKKWRYTFVHQRMRFQKVERQIRQCSWIIVTSTRSWVRHFAALNRQPVRVEGFLLFKVTFKGVCDILQGESAHRTSWYTIWRGCKSAVNKLSWCISVLTFYKFSCRFCKLMKKIYMINYLLYIPMYNVYIYISFCINCK